MQIAKLFLRLVFVFFLAFSLSACNDDDGISSTNGGGSSGDGGAQSAQYAGVYNGTVTVNYQSEDLSGSRAYPARMNVNRNGTVSLTIDGETIAGVINGNKVAVDLKLTQTENITKCEVNIAFRATIVGNKMTGPITGDGTCRQLVTKRDATVSGNINLSK